MTTVAWLSKGASKIIGQTAIFSILELNYEKNCSDETNRGSYAVN